MPQYEIIAHLRYELEGETAEDAAALFRRRVLTDTDVADDLLHLAVWRQDRPSGDSALPDALRQQLREFFAALDRCAIEAEADFRDRVAAILASSARDNGDAIDNPSGPGHATQSAESRKISS